MAKKHEAKPPNGGSLSAHEPTSIGRANVQREIVTASTFVTLYTNDTQVQLTPWDVRLIFGEITDLPTEDRPTAVVKRTGEVRMSPQHAKKLVQILLSQLEIYEQGVGPIPMPED